MRDRIVISGASGFIGSALAQWFVFHEFEVIGLVRADARIPESLMSSPRFKTVECPFSAYRHFPDFVGDGRIRAVYHVAWAGVGQASAGVPAWSTNLNNIRAACELAEGSKQVGAERFIFCGSDWMYKRSAFNSDIPGVFDVYGIAKRAASDMCRQILTGSGVLYECALLVNTFGPGDYSSKAVNTFIRALLRNETLNLIPASAVTDWTYIEDAVRALASLLEVSEDGREWYLGHGAPISFGSLVKQLRDAVDSDSSLAFGVYPEQSFVDYEAIDMGALGRVTGFSCQTPFQDAFQRTAEWIRALDKTRQPE